MKTFLTILLILAMAATVFALIRGIVQFLKTSTAELHQPGPSPSGIKQNQAMRMRIFFQATAILIVILLLMLSGTRG